LFLFINQAIIGYGSQEDANTTGNDLSDLLIGNSPGYIQFGSNGERDYRQTGLAGFAQDTYRVNNSLTLSLGVRYEYVGPVSDTQNRVAYYRPTAAAKGISSTLLSSGQLLDTRGRVISVPAGQRAPLGLLYPGDPDPDLGGVVPNSFLIVV
jgi:outer membrane receptor protein involved in Fe transport